ncbi:hypothetical protein PV328_003595 [Microctonus aethiopoides]|uniref:Anamorsin homolog n=1 Tax=Microctonus aethiopoides TaxID=144406 RepID=A0AA39KKN8_9HYME|nr:hypothetical protein PV328_003595 [Microctonus aethiopoides]
MIWPVKKEDKLLILVDSIMNENDIQKLIGEINKITEHCNEIMVMKWTEFQTSDHEITIDVILSFASQAIPTSKFLKILNHGGSIVLHKSIKSEKKDEIKDVFASDILQLGISGFVFENIEILNSPSIHTIKELLGYDSNNDICKIVAKKPSYEAGSNVTLSFPKLKTNIWKVDDVIEDDLINEDSLLDEEDEIKPIKPTSTACDIADKKKRKACKDCTCGLSKELNDAVEIKNESSSCGNCYLGDAFRCGSCPYLGTPAFKPGEKVFLPNNQVTIE